MLKLPSNSSVKGEVEGNSNYKGLMAIDLSNFINVAHFKLQTRCVKSEIKDWFRDQ